MSKRTIPAHEAILYKITSVYKHKDSPLCVMFVHQYNNSVISALVSGVVAVHSYVPTENVIITFDDGFVMRTSDYGKNLQSFVGALERTGHACGLQVLDDERNDVEIGVER